jgi:hypothetical protein
MITVSNMVETDFGALLINQYFEANHRYSLIML